MRANKFGEFDAVTIDMINEVGAFLDLAIGELNDGDVAAARSILLESKEIIDDLQSYNRGEKDDQIPF